MSDSNEARPVREIAVAERIWEAFEQMAVEMGTERDGLVNQAMFMFARLNGFLDPGRMLAAAAQASPAHEREGSEADSAPADELADPPEPEPEPEPEPDPEPNLGENLTPVPQAAPVRRSTGPRREPALAARLHPDDDARRRMTEAAMPESFDPPADAGEDPDRKAVAERVLETAAELERLIKGKQQPATAEEPLPQLRPDPTAVGASPDPSGHSLFMMADDGSTEKIAKERYLIGRGKHCDMVINSGKVSREHAAITHEGEEFYIEDLGSSNGTWFNKQRIKRRKIEDGDEFFICSDKVKFAIR